MASLVNIMATRRSDGQQIQVRVDRKGFGSDELNSVIDQLEEHEAEDIDMDVPYKGVGVEDLYDLVTTFPEEFIYATEGKYIELSEFEFLPIVV